MTVIINFLQPPLLKKSSCINLIQLLMSTKFSMFSKGFRKREVMCQNFIYFVFVIIYGGKNKIEVGVSCWRVAINIWNMKEFCFKYIIHTYLLWKTASIFAFAFLVAHVKWRHAHTTQVETTSTSSRQKLLEDIRLALLLFNFLWMR